MSRPLIHIAVAKCLEICIESKTPYSALRDCLKQLEAIGWQPNDISTVEAGVTHLLVQSRAPLPGTDRTKTWRPLLQSK